MSTCTLCHQSASHFALADKVCRTCLDSRKSEAKGKLARVFSSSPGWGSLFVLGLAAHVYFITKGQESAVLSAVLMSIALLAFAAAFITRFYVVRRSFNIPFALLTTFPAAAMLLSTVGALKAGGVASLTTLAFVCFPYYVLRVPNLFEVRTEKTDK